MNERPNIHPGEILSEEFLKPAGLSAAELARDLRLSYQLIRAIIDGRQAVCAEISLRLAHYFGTSDRFWLDTQVEFDLARARRAFAPLIGAIVPLRCAA